MAISIIYWLLVISSACYFLVILAITVGWFQTKQFNSSVLKPFVPVSIVVAVRNEETNILKLLKCLIDQDYPSSNIEIIVVDDHSEDETKKVIEDFIFLNNSFNISLSDAIEKGKKKAITQGLEFASGELIITTDGDCEMGNKWLSRLVAFYQENSSALIIGPVVYNKSNHLCDKIFSLEFISLVASGAGSAGIGMPFMGNGANLGFSRELIAETKVKDGRQYASGDDVFLIQQIAKNKGAHRVKFIRDPEAIVTTDAPRSIHEFIKQRIRWASKAKGYKSPWSIVVALVVFGFNFMLILTLLASSLETWMAVIFALFIIFKLLIDIPLLYEFTGFVNRRKLMLLLPVLEFIYPLYIVISSAVGLFFRYEWKGRKGLH